MTGQGCPSTTCAEIAYNYNDSTSAVLEGTCQYGNDRDRTRVSGDKVRDYMCLGDYESFTDLCAPQMTFCAITDVNMNMNIFMYINGVIGFAPIKDGDLEAETQSFIYQTENTVERASWNFNFDPTPSTLRLGGKNLEDANGGFLTV